jgi:hypothetical protein
VCSDQVCDRGLLAKQISNGVLQVPRSNGHSTVLTHVLYPGINKKSLNKAALVLSILKHAPGIRTILLSLLA